MKRKLVLGICILFFISSLYSLELSPQRQALITNCLKLHGIPYLWGGETPDGFDCSGFVMYVAKNGVTYETKVNGKTKVEKIKIILPRNSNQMFLRTIPVSHDEREPGDLVFFKENMNAEKITHVGVYCGVYHGSIKEFEGKRVFISALSEGDNRGIQLRPIDNPYWQNRVYSYGRILVTSKQFREGHRVIKRD